MTVNNCEHYEIMESFERLKPGRLDRERRSEWPKGRIYQDGQVNELFLMYREGCACGRCAYLNGGA